MINLLKRNKAIFAFIKRIYQFFQMIVVIPSLTRLKFKNSIKDDKKIKFVFISQMPSMWTNVNSVYQTLIRDKDFDVYILSIPEYDYSQGEFSEKNIEFNAYLYHNQHGHYTNINAFENNKWFSLQDFNPDYVWYERPYSSYLPKQYRINEVIKYAKTCYLPYGYELLDGLLETVFNIKFIRYVYMLFADNDVTYDYTTKITFFLQKLGLKKVLKTGHPIFKEVLSKKNDKSVFWSKDNNRYKVIWTPRWTENHLLGGSNFLNYKDVIVDYVNKDDCLSLVFRPHPLTFKNFLSKNLITQDDLDNYLLLYKNNERMYYDNQPEYFTTFWNSDVLVTDFSSVIPYYFLTGKPIIYCHTEFNSFGKILPSILEVSYQVYNEEQLCRVLDNLKQGKDELKEKRILLRDKMFLEESVINIPNRILEAIKQDFNSNKK